MLGSLSLPGMFREAGFLPAGLSGSGIDLGPSIPILTRGAARPEISPELQEALNRLSAGGDVQRGEVTGDLSQILHHFGATIAELQRGITSTTSGLPIRENLEAEATGLVPLDTPLRNMLPRRPGAGTASAWRQLTSLGGGWATTLDQGGTGGAIRAFFSETGAPAEHTSTYASKSGAYKLLGTYGSVTGFAAAAGANFQNQLAVEKTHALNNLMLNEEYALIAGDSTSTAAPWGDGATAMAFDGLIPLTATANGTPSAQVQTAVGALTLAHIDAQLTRIWKQGGRNPFLLINAQEQQSLVNLAQASGTVIRMMATAQGDTILGMKVTGIKHPITGDIVPVYVSRFMTAGTIQYGAQYGPDGKPAIDVEVLPQVQLPELAPNQNIQGYTAQELAPTTAAPQVYPFIITVYELLRMKNALVFAKSTGVTAV
jgi:hypothetical protein